MYDTAVSFARALPQSWGRLRGSTLARQAVAVGAWNVASRAIAAVGTMYAARCLGPSYTGISGIVIATAQQAALACNGGLDPVAVRRLSADEPTGNMLVRGTLWLRVALLMPVLSLWIAIVLSRQAGTARNVWLLGLPILVTSACPLSFAFQAAGAVSKLSMLTALGSLGTGLLYFLTLAPGMPLGSDLRVQSGVVLIVWVVALFKTRSLWGSLRPSALALTKAFGMLRQSWRYWLQAVVSSFYTLFQIPLIAYLLGASDAGQYRVALSLASGVDIVFISLGSVLLPRMTRWNQLGQIHFHLQIQRLNRILLAVAVPSILLGIAVVPFVVPAFLGPAYRPSISVLQILLLARLAILLGQTYSQAMIAMSRDRRFLGISLAATAFSVTASFVMIPIAGVQGAAVVSLLTELLILICMACSVSQARRLSQTI